MTGERLSPVEVPGVFVRRLAASRRAPVYGVELKLFRLAAGASTSAHAHAHRHEVYVLSGSGLVEASGEERPIKVADHVSVLDGNTHRFSAGDAGLAFLCVEWRERNAAAAAALAAGRE